MEIALIKIIASFGIEYITPLTEKELPNLFHLFNDGTMFTPTTGLECSYLGLWYKQNGDVENMKKYYLMAIEHGNSAAMNNMAIWCGQNDDIENMKKYYLMSIEHGNSAAMTNLGRWSKRNGDVENMKKYYLMSIEHGNSAAMTNLGRWSKQNGDVENMKKYYIMAIEHGNSTAMNNLGYWYYENGDVENMKKYYLMAIEHGFITAMTNLGYWYYENGDLKRYAKYTIMAESRICHWNVHVMPYIIKYNKTEIFKYYIEEHLANVEFPSPPVLNWLSDESIPLGDSHHAKQFRRMLRLQLDIAELHFNYSVHGLGYEDAKRDYIKTL